MFDKSLRSLPLVGLNEFRVSTHEGPEHYGDTINFRDGDTIFCQTNRRFEYLSP